MKNTSQGSTLALKPNTDTPEVQNRGIGIPIQMDNEIEFGDNG